MWGDESARLTEKMQPTSGAIRLFPYTANHLKPRAANAKAFAMLNQIGH